jgi:hypothetical protein
MSPAQRRLLGFGNSINRAQNRRRAGQDQPGKKGEKQPHSLCRPDWPQRLMEVNSIIGICPPSPIAILHLTNALPCAML